MSETTKDPNPLRCLDLESLEAACKAFNGAEELSIEERMGRAILAYVALRAVKTAKDGLKHGLPSSELPLEIMYPDIHDRYIAVQERRRAINVITECFEDIGTEILTERSELALFLALIQGEIEGP